MSKCVHPETYHLFSLIDDSSRLFYLSPTYLVYQVCTWGGRLRVCVFRLLSCFYTVTISSLLHIFTAYY